MTMMSMNYQEIINEIYETVLPMQAMGRQATYIPALAEVNPEQTGMCVETLDGRRYAVGDTDVRFSIQSISKVFSLAMALSLEGDKVWKRMGREPSGASFNSLVQLELEFGKPRNPFINAGAIVVADILASRLENPEEDFIGFVRSISNDTSIGYNDEVALSEYSCGYLNAAIANVLKFHNNLEGDIDCVLRLYYRICSVEMTCCQLAQAFLPFADHRREFCHSGVRLTTSQVKRMNAVMQTCGFYDEAGDFSFLVGLPGKSGVGGGIAAVCPGNYSVAVWSPRLNAKGNSVVGMKMLELLTTMTEESVF